MLISGLFPLLTYYSLGLDLSAGPDGTVTLVVIPRKAQGAKHDPGANEVRPISITASAAEIDAELALGPDGALGQLIAARKTLADQIAEQRAEADAAKAEAAKAKAKTATTKQTPAKAAPAPSPAPAETKAPAEPDPGEPVSLY